MTRRYHPQTQKAIKKWALHYLQLYRNSRTCGDDPATARWRSNFALCIAASGNVYHIIQSRIMKNNNKYWKVTQTKPATEPEQPHPNSKYAMVQGEGAAQFCFDIADNTQLAMF